MAGHGYTLVTFSQSEGAWAQEDGGICFPVFSPPAKLLLLLVGALGFFLYCNFLFFFLPLNLGLGHFSYKLWVCSVFKHAVRNIVHLYVTKLKHGLKQVGRLFVLLTKRRGSEEFLWRLSSPVFELVQHLSKEGSFSEERWQNQCPNILDSFLCLQQHSPKPIPHSLSPTPI